MVVIILYAILLLTVGLLCVILRKSAMAIFNTLWALVIFLCREDLCLESYSQTLLLLTIMIVMVNAGCLLGSVELTSRVRFGLLTDRRQFDSRLLTLLLSLAGLIFLFYAVRTAARFGFDLELIRGTNNSDSEDKVFSSLLDTIAFYGVAMPVIYVGALVCAYNFSQQIRTPRHIYVLILLDMVLYVLTAGGRSMFIRVALFFAAAVLWRMKKPGGINMKWFKYVLLAVAGLLVVMELLTAARNSRDISFLEQAVMYIRGAVSHMRYQLERMRSDSWYFGYITYGGFFYYPVTLVSRVLGTDWQTSNEILAFLQKFKYIRVGSESVNYNALVPNVFYYYFDSGYLGVVLFSLFLGLAAGAGERAHAKPGFFRFVLWATAVYAIVYSPMDSVLWPFRYPTALIYCFVLRNLIYRPVDGGNDGTADQCHHSNL